MLALTPHLRVLVAVEPADFRRGIDGLAQLCRDALQEEPMSGVVFVFRNRRGSSVKLLAYDGQGSWLCQERFSRGRVSWWPMRERTRRSQTLESHELSVLLAGGDPTRARGAPAWRPLRPAA
jgi:transposase